MTTRNLTGKFVSARYKSHKSIASQKDSPANNYLAIEDNHTTSLKSNGEKQTIDNKLLISEPYDINKSQPWIKPLNDLNTYMDTIKREIVQLDRLQKEKLKLVSFSNEQKAYEKKLEQDIDVLTNKIKVMLSKCKTELKKFETLSGYSNKEMIIINNATKSKIIKLKDIAELFKINQKHYLTYVAKIYNDDFSKEFLPSMHDDHSGHDIENQTSMETELSEEQLHELTYMKNMTLERKQDISNILNSIDALDEIFNDLSLMVTNQGELIDRIDHNVEITANQIASGVKQLDKAKKHQSNKCPVISIGIMMIIVLILVIVLIVKNS